MSKTRQARLICPECGMILHAEMKWHGHLGMYEYLYDLCNCPRREKTGRELKAKVGASTGQDS